MTKKDIKTIQSFIGILTTPIAQRKGVTIPLRIVRLGQKS